jgi:hypothetical protein
MVREEAKTFMVEDAQLIFRNFSGKEGQYNREGDRNFAVILDDESAQAMIEDGWNIRFLEPREEGDTTTPYISVTVKFDIMPPTVIMITSSGRVRLDEDSVAVLDWANIQTVDLIGRAYEWTVNGKSGIKAYLKSMYVTIEEDALERKYANVEDKT